MVSIKISFVLLLIAFAKLLVSATSTRVVFTSNRPNVFSNKDTVPPNMPVAAIISSPALAKLITTDAIAAMPLEVAMQPIPSSSCVSLTSRAVVVGFAIRV